MSMLCTLGFHGWTSDVDKGKPPTKDQLSKGVDGFFDYSKIYCSRCGKINDISKRILESDKMNTVYGDKYESSKEKNQKLLEKELLKMAYFFNNAVRVNYFRIACQGDHAITGGTCVVSVKHNARSINEVKSVIFDLFHGRENTLIKDFTRRAKEKLGCGAYANYISIHGEDLDMDKIDVDFRFQSQQQMMQICENGLFRLEDSNNDYLLLRQ